MQLHSVLRNLVFFCLLEFAVCQTRAINKHDNDDDDNCYISYRDSITLQYSNTGA